MIETYDERGNFVKNELKEESALYYPIEKVSISTIPAVKESSIWLENNVGFVFDKEDEKNLSIEDIRLLKEQADSLGIDIEDFQ